MAWTEPGAHTQALTHFEGRFLRLDFQDGPVQEHGLNGTTNEEVLTLLIERITSLNTMYERKFACRENSPAITKLEEALHWLEARTNKRVARGVEGTNIP